MEGIIREWTMPSIGCFHIAPERVFYATAQPAARRSDEIGKNFVRIADPPLFSSPRADPAKAPWAAAAQINRTKLIVFWLHCCLLACTNAVGCGWGRSIDVIGRVAFCWHGAACPRAKYLCAKYLCAMYSRSKYRRGGRLTFPCAGSAGHGTGRLYSRGAGLDRHGRH